MKLFQTNMKSEFVFLKKNRCLPTALYIQLHRDTTKNYIFKLLFLHSAHHPMLDNISVKSHEDILNGFKVKQEASFCH